MKHADDVRGRALDRAARLAGTSRTPSLAPSATGRKWPASTCGLSRIRPGTRTRWWATGPRTRSGGAG